MDRAAYSKQHLQELKNINLSLSTLSKVILQLSSASYQHVHFRESKLTRVLQDSLVGRNNTVLLATVSPISYCLAQIAAISKTLLIHYYLQRSVLASK
jgi:hypothetical protein